MNKKQWFQISVRIFDQNGKNPRDMWQLCEGERIDESKAIRREQGQGWVIWDIKTGLAICTKKARSKAEALAYFEERFKEAYEKCRKGTAYARNVEKARACFNDPAKEWKPEAETVEAIEEEKTEAGSNKITEETKTVDEIKALPAPRQGGADKEAEQEATRKTVEEKTQEKTEAPATERQTKYLTALARKLHNRAIIDLLIDYSTLTKETASRLIDESIKAIERGRKGNKIVPRGYLLNHYRATA